MFSISERHIDVEMLLANVKDDCAGATILFLGTVRNHNDDYAVSGIYYEAYIRMAEEAMAKSEEEVGVAIAVSSEHRAEAFEAGRYAIDRIKTEVPIWKKEITSGKGGIWAQGAPMGGT